MNALLESERAKRYLEKFQVPFKDQEVIAGLILNYEYYFEVVDSNIDALKEYISKNKLDTKSRKRELVHKRAYLYKYLRLTCPDMSLARIGSLFGGRGHDTVLNGINTCNSMIETGDKEFKRNINITSKQFTIWH